MNDISFVRPCIECAVLVFIYYKALSGNCHGLISCCFIWMELNIGLNIVMHWWQKNKAPLKGKYFDGSHLFDWNFI